MDGCGTGLYKCRWSKIPACGAAHIGQTVRLRCCRLAGGLRAREAMMSNGRRHLTVELIVLGVTAFLLVGAAAFVCVSAFKARHANGGVVVAGVFETVAPA